VRYRKLGKAGFAVSEIGCGTWGMGGNLWFGGSDAESLAALHRAIELGVNFIDTALVYGDGHSEQLVGQALQNAGRKVYVATKVPPKNRLWPARPGVSIDEVFPYDHIIESTEQSLRNLRMEAVDLQQLHVWNPDWLERDEWKRALEDLKQSGKAKAVGVSVNDHQPDTALDVITTGRVDAVQVLYNVFDQAAAQRLFPLAQQHDVGVVARVPFDEGSLTGQIRIDTEFDPRDFRSRYFRGDRKKQVVERVDALTSELGIESGALPEIALRCCLSHPAVSTVIPGMRDSRHVERNCEASEKGPLPEETLAILRRHGWPHNFYGRE
jgi:aryl-alcohol dehydrogenase-like predicted oxidoreductase